MLGNDIKEYPFSGIYKPNVDGLKKNQPKSLGCGMVKASTDGTVTHDLNTIYGDFFYVTYNTTRMFYENGKPVMLVDSSSDAEWISDELTDVEKNELLIKCIKAGYVIKKETV